MRIAVLFSRLGPYHLARLRAASSCLQVAAVEYVVRDSTYNWDVVRSADRIERVTLFTDDSAKSRPAASIRTAVLKALEKLQPEVVAIPGWGDRCSLAALLWGLERRVPAVVMSDSTVSDKLRSWWKEHAKRRIVSQFGAALVAGMPQAAYLHALGMPTDRIFLGYDAVDNEYFARRAKEVISHKSEVRSQLGLPERYFLACSRFIESKNLSRLLQAYARYRELCAKGQEQRAKGEEPWDLVLLGDGPLRSSLLVLRSSLGLQDSVLLPGFKQYDELPAYYGLARAFILPSVPHETWGLVVNEAMACGLPVLVSNRCGCAPDLVQEGVNGFTFDPYDVERLAQLILRLSSLPSAQRTSLGSESQRIIASWGPERFAQGLKAAAEKALEAGPAEPTLTQRLILKALCAR